MTQESIDFVICAASWALCLISNVRYEFGRRSSWDHGHRDEVVFTPFAASLPLICMFWTAMSFLQMYHLGRIFHHTTRTLTWHFIGSNCLLLLWSYLFSRGHYMLSLMVAICDLFNLTFAYAHERSYRVKPIVHWLGAHAATVALPLQWVLYLVIWNGAVLFNGKHEFGAWVSNTIIWCFLVIPAIQVSMYRDWASGFAGAWIAGAIGFGQLASSSSGMQFAYALTISGLLLCFTTVTMCVFFSRYGMADEEAPLLTNSP